MTHIKNIITVLALVFTANILFAQTEWTKKESETYTLSYPNDWNYKDDAGSGLVFTLMSPAADDKDDFSENINLIETAVPEGSNLDELKEPLIEQLKAVITDFKLVSMNKTAKGMEVVYTGSMGKYKLKWKQWYILKGDKAYILSFTAQTATYATYLPTAEKIIASFSPAK